jgi:hypothetical protein
MSSIYSIQQWEKQRQLGKGKFILVHGVLGWGCLTAVLVSMLSWVTNSYSLSIDAVIRNFITYPAGGVIFGWWLWNHRESKYIIEVSKMSDSERKGM